MTPKYNPADVLPETISAVLMAMIYDEVNFPGRCRELFGFGVHCWTDRTGRYFYAAVVDTVNNRLWIVYRGTDGNNAWGRFLSWITNLRIGINREGYHKGFYKIASDSIPNLSQYLRRAKTVYIAGHSQGGGTAVPATAMISHYCKSGLLNLMYFQTYLFAAPPAVNKKGKAEIDGFVDNGFVKIFNWQQSGDPILTVKLRKKHGPLAGCDVGEIIKLPNVIPDNTPQDLASHSPSIYLWAYRKMVQHELDKDVITHVLESGWVVN